MNEGPYEPPRVESIGEYPRLRSHRFWIALAVSAMLPCGCTVIAFRADPWIQLAIAIVVGGFFGVLAAIQVAVSWLRKQRSTLRGRAKPDLVGVAAWASLTICVGFVLAAPVGVLVQRRDVVEAKKWVEANVQRIDAFHGESGSYPQEIEGVVDVAGAPFLWSAGQVLYKSDADGHSFDIITGPYAGHVWGSANRRWVDYD